MSQISQCSACYINPSFLCSDVDTLSQLQRVHATKEMDLRMMQLSRSWEHDDSWSSVHLKPRKHQHKGEFASCNMETCLV